MGTNFQTAPKAILPAGSITTLGAPQPGSLMAQSLEMSGQLPAGYTPPSYAGTRIAGWDTYVARYTGAAASTPTKQAYGSTTQPQPSANKNTLLGGSPSSTSNVGSTSPTASGPGPYSGQAQPGKINTTADPLGVPAEQRSGTGTMWAGIDWDGNPVTGVGGGPYVLPVDVGQGTVPGGVTDVPGGGIATAPAGLTPPPQNAIGAFFWGIALWVEHPVFAAQQLIPALQAVVATTATSIERSAAAGVIALPVLLIWLLFFRRPTVLGVRV